jgi:hypothetical protein
LAFRFGLELGPFLYSALARFISPRLVYGHLFVPLLLTGQTDKRTKVPAWGTFSFDFRL